jgi:hypothetical protein
MRHGCWIGMVVLVLGAMGLAAGCGNVSVQGDAMTALESSTMDAFGYLERVQVDANASPLTRGYAEENFVQWRWFARSAKKDLNWGPKLPSEANTVSTGASTTMPAYSGMPLTDLAHGYE